MKEKWDMWVPFEKNKKKTNINVKTDGCSDKIQAQREIYFYFLLFISFLDLRKSDRRNSSSQERKVLYATRATRG